MNAPLDVEALCRRDGPMVLRRCHRLLRDEEEAVNVRQDVFVRFIDRRDRLDVRHPSSLLCTMATTPCLDRLRDRRRQGDAERGLPVRLQRVAGPRARRLPGEDRTAS